MKTPQKLTALVLAGVLASSSIAAVPASAKTFTDVPVNHWAYQVVDKISNKGIMVGVGNDLFSPNSTLTRAEYTAILCNLSPDKSNGLNYAAHLNDVPANAWYAEAAEWGVTHGIIKEIDGDFKPDAVVSRELMADMTYKFLYYELYGAIEEDATSVGYADADQISPDYKKSVDILSNNGLLAGRGGNQFVPQGTLTRAEAAAMASRLIEVIDAFEAENPGDNPSEKPEQPVDPDNPAEEPEQPIEPETPAEEPSEPADDPSSWDLDGAPSWFLVGQPDNITDEQWDKLVKYWTGKDYPVGSGYPSSINSLPANYRDNEELAKEFCGARMDKLYNIMQRDYAEQALAADGSADISSEETEMVNLVNQARREAGVSELTISPALCRAADIRAKEALTCEPHRRPDGSSFATVLEENDVGLVYNFLNGSTNAIYVSENQALWRNHSVFTPEYASDGFMNSAGHRKNLLTDTHKYIGVGYYSDGRNSAWIQLFGRTQ